ncbi:MAG: patatin-like phospholipase family protein [Sedimenticolaceae bacterium]
MVHRLFMFGLAVMILSGCSTYGRIENQPLTAAAPEQAYTMRGPGRRPDNDDVKLYLAFSGGGSRAAALAYGVLQELRDTTAVFDGRSRRLLDEIDAISSVSGGSFTSAYYGLYGDQIFDDFEDVFLRRDVQGHLINALFNPLQWFSSNGRTELAVKYYEEQVFHGATFADLHKSGGPLVLINASDLSYGVRFSFVQEYFNLLCSDIASFPVARAVTASSAVPVLFNPVVVEDYQDCKNDTPDWLTAAEQAQQGSPQMIEVINGLKSYFKKSDLRYSHFVDGGITDNLGLRALYEIIELAGGARAFSLGLGKSRSRSLVVVSVNAATNPDREMDRSNRSPSIKETIGAVSSIQLRRYNADTLQLLDDKLKDWAHELSTPDRPVDVYFIKLSFSEIGQPETLRFFNLIPTSFALSDEQVDKLISAGRKLLRNNPDFQRFLAAHGGKAAVN